MILYYLFSWILLGSSARLSWFFSVVQVIWLLDWFWVISEFFTHMSGSLNWMVDLGVLSYKWLFSAVFGLLSSRSVDWAALHGIFKIELSEREREQSIFSSWGLSSKFPYHHFCILLFWKNLDANPCSENGKKLYFFNESNDKVILSTLYIQRWQELGWIISHLI